MTSRAITLALTAFAAGLVVGLLLFPYTMEEELIEGTREVIADMAAERLDSHYESLDAGLRLSRQAQTLSEKTLLLMTPPGNAECELWRRATAEYRALVEAKRYYETNDPDVLAGATGREIDTALAAFDGSLPDRRDMCNRASEAGGDDA